MNLVLHSIRSKGVASFARRVGMIFSRFGFTSSKFVGNLTTYIESLGDIGGTVTFPITAVLVERHEMAVQNLRATGVEFAVHGYVHRDHTLISAQQQFEEIGRALAIFQKANIPVAGFRSPYLRYDDGTLAAVQKLGFQYISNQAVWYDVVDRGSIGSLRWASLQKALAFYAVVPADLVPVRPWMRGDVVEIPIAMPDDEILIDRLGVQDGRCLAEIWERMLDQSFVKGDLLTLQVHPERGGTCREAVTLTIKAARSKSQPVWIAGLGEIAAWWRKRASFKLDVVAVGENRWRVSGPADPDATVLLRRGESAVTGEGFGRYTVISGGRNVVVCAVKPVISVSPRSVSLREFLVEEGFAVSCDTEQVGCALYFDRPGDMTTAEQVAVLAEIEQSSVPLVRLGRWPKGARSAMSITGDIDALTVPDFFMRSWEVR